MALIVQKFGGTSVGDLDRIRNVASRVKAEVDAGNSVAVVVSAMAGTTNQLVAWARDIGPMHDAREYDTIVATGEQVTVGLLAIALQNLGVDARSWLGWQIPLHTDEVHGAARIESIDTGLMRERLAGGQVAVVAGFQGLAPDGRVSTLGRGGSDTSAVALAAALDAIVATSTPMSTVSIQPIRGSRQRHRNSIRSHLRKCSKWRLSAPRCCRQGRSRWRCGIM